MMKWSELGQSYLTLTETVLQHNLNLRGMYDLRWKSYHYPPPPPDILNLISLPTRRQKPNALDRTRSQTNKIYYLRE